MLIDLVYAAKSAYRANGHFVMNRATAVRDSQDEDVDGTYLWQPSLEAGAPATLLGYPIAESEDMPDIATDSLSIAFGDFSRGYLIVDRVGIRVLRDPYSFEALCAVLHDQACGRRCSRLRCDQADEVRRVRVVPGLANGREQRVFAALVFPPACVVWRGRNRALAVPPSLLDWSRAHIAGADRRFCGSNF